MRKKREIVPTLPHVPGESMSSLALPPRKRMGGRTQSPEARLLALSRRVKVAEMTVRGQAQSSIAVELGVSLRTIKDDLALIRADWRTLEVKHFEEHVNEQLRKIEAVEREAWAAWERSKEPKESYVVTKDKGVVTSSVIKEESQVGDPQFLAQIDRCIGRRCSLLGLNAAKKTEVSASVETNVNVNVTMPRRDQMREVVLQRIKASSGLASLLESN